MWEKCTSGIRPVELDTESSTTYNYIRKSIKEVEVTHEGITTTQYEYFERKVPKSEWETYTRLSDLEDALCELSKEE